MKLEYEPLPKLDEVDPEWLRDRREEHRSARSASRMLGTLLLIWIFLCGGIAWAVVERWILS